MDNAAPPEGNFALPTQGATELIKVFVTERRMKVYGVTENELNHLTAINLAITGLFSAGTGCFAFALDLHKDLLLVDTMPAKAEILANLVQPVALIAGAAFYFFGWLFWMKRGSFIETIKHETK